MMTHEDYTRAFKDCAASALQVWDATWGTRAEVITATADMHDIVTAAFRLAAGELPQEVLHTMSAAAEDAVLELRTIFPEVFCGDYGDSARLIYEALKMLDDHLHHHPAPRRTGLRAVQPSQRHLVH